MKFQWCNSYLVPKANGKIRLCLDPVLLNKALIRPIHRGPTLNDILPRLEGVKYLMLIDGSSQYHNQKIQWKVIICNNIFCPLGRYWYIRLPLGAAQVGYMFKRKIDELFYDIPNVFGIADDILIAGFDADGMDHDASLKQVLWRCRQANHLGGGYQSMLLGLGTDHTKRYMKEPNQWGEKKHTWSTMMSESHYT